MNNIYQYLIVFNIIQCKHEVKRVSHNRALMQRIRKVSIGSILPLREGAPLHKSVRQVHLVPERPNTYSVSWLRLQLHTELCHLNDLSHDLLTEIQSNKANFERVHYSNKHPLSLSLLYYFTYNLQGVKLVPLSSTKQKTSTRI